MTELIVAGIGLVVIIALITYLWWRVYRLMLARVSTKIMLELNSMDKEKVTIKDLQDLAEYLKSVKKLRKITEKSKEYDVMYN